MLIGIILEGKYIHGNFHQAALFTLAGFFVGLLIYTHRRERCTFISVNSRATESLFFLC